MHLLLENFLADILGIKRLVYIPKKGAHLSTDSFHLRRRLPTLPLLRSSGEMHVQGLSLIHIGGPALTIQGPT